MQTHEDMDFYNRLEQRAQETVARRGSDITGGAPGELPIQEYHANSVYVRRMRADEQGILRISVGGGFRDEMGQEINYCTFRGPHLRCVELLKKALRALETNLNTD